MNDRRPLDQQQLEQATSRDLPASLHLDDETRQLQEGWLALGRALEQSRGDFDADALVKQLQAEVVSASAVERQQPPAATTWWIMLLGTALALTMMLALFRSLKTVDSQPPIASQPSHASDQVAGTPDEPANAADEPLAWSDPLDTQIDEATEQVQSLIAQVPTLDDSLSGLSEQMQSLASEFDNGSL